MIIKGIQAEFQLDEINLFRKLSFTCPFIILGLSSEELKNNIWPSWGRWGAAAFPFSPSVPCFSSKKPRRERGSRSLGEQQAVFEWWGHLWWRSWRSLTKILLSVMMKNVGTDRVPGGIVAINFWFLQQMPALPPKVIIAWDSNHHQSLHQFLGQSFLTMIFLLVLTFNLALTIALVTLLFVGQWSLKRISTYTLLIRWHINRFEVNWPPEPTLVLRWISKFFLFGALPSDTLKIKHTKNWKKPLLDMF